MKMRKLTGAEMDFPMEYVQMTDSHDTHVYYIAPTTQKMKCLIKRQIENDLSSWWARNWRMPAGQPANVLHDKKFYLSDVTTPVPPAVTL